MLVEVTVEDVTFLGGPDEAKYTEFSYWQYRSLHRILKREVQNNWS